MEKYNKSINQDKTRNNKEGLSRKLSKAAFAVGTLITLGTVSKRLDKEIMDTDKAKDVEVVPAEGIIIHGGPNLRSDARIPNGPEDIDGSNVIYRFEDTDELIELVYSGDTYIYEDAGDPNGAWVGLPAREIADALYESGQIDKRTRDKIAKDDDGYVWINKKYVDLKFEVTEETNY